MSDKPPPKRTKSDTYPAVTKYRKKLHSIEDGVLSDSIELEKILTEYLEVQSSKPPAKLEKLEDQDDIDTVKISIPTIPKKD